MKIKSVLLGCVAVSAMGTFAAPAFADTAPAASSSSLSGDIVVTARRKEESLQSVPISVNVLSQKDLTERSITSAADVSKISTGLGITADSGNPSAITFSIRGRGQNYGSATGSVETYFADIPLSSTFQMPAPPPQFFDLNAFQVLKGPQGTLFGRNTTGGAVVIVPQAPKIGVTEGYVRVQGGTYDDFQIEGALNLPLGEKAALRIAAFDWQRKGYINSSPVDIWDYIASGGHSLPGPQTDVTNGGAALGSQNFNNVNTTQLRASLLVKPTDAIENTTVVSYIIDKTRSSASRSLWQGERVSPTESNPFGATVAGGPSCGNYCAYINVSLTKPASKYLMVANTTKFDVTDNLKIKNILGYIDSSAYGNVATDATGSSEQFALIDLPGVARAQKNQQFTEELQLQGNTSDHKLSYTIGGMYDKTSQPTGINDINIYSVSYSGAASHNLNAVNFQSTNVTSKALYASATYTPIDRLNITGGFRQTWLDLSQTQGFNAYLSGDAPSLSPAGAITTFAHNFSGSTYNLGVDYHLDNATMVYGGYRHGWKRGGINPSSQNGDTFAPETVDSFALGVKSKFNLADVPVRVNMELFYDKYTGLQTAYLAIGDNQLITNTVGIDKSLYQGFDLDVAMQPANWLDLSGSWTFNDTKINRWVDHSSSFAADLTKNHLPYVSKNKFSLTSRVHGDLPGNIGEAVWMTTVNYQSKYYDNAFQTVSPGDAQMSFFFTNPASFCADGMCGNTIQGYATVDMRVELNHAFGSRFDLAAGVTNLTNKYYLLGSGATIQFGAEGFAVAPPRMWTFEVKTKF